MATSTLRKPPQEPPLFTTNAHFIVEAAERLIEHSRSVQASIIHDVHPSTATFANTVLPLALEENVRKREAHVLGFYQHVSADGDLRAASRRAEGIVQNFSVETAMREDIFTIVQAVSARSEELDPQSRHYLEKEKSVSHHVLSSHLQFPGQ